MLSLSAYKRMASRVLTDEEETIVASSSFVTMIAPRMRGITAVAASEVVSKKANDRR